MNNQTTLSRPRVAFLLLLALVVTLLFFWVVKDFLMALFFAAVMAGLLHPLYRRVLKWMGGRNGLAAVATVFLSLVLIIVPLILFFWLVIGEAIQISESAKEWVATQEVTTESLRKEIESDEDLKRLLPYQDELVAKANELAAKAGGWIAQGLAGAVKGTAAFFLSLFVMLFAMFFFLRQGREILEASLRYTPLSRDDRTRLLGTFVSVARATLKGKLVIGLVQGGLAALSFWVAGIEGVFFWGAVMMVLSIIPAIGTSLIWVPAVIFLAMNGQTVEAVGVALWCGIVVGYADNVLNPILVGKETEMPDLLVMITTLGGLAVFGAAGILIGPTVGALYVAVWKLWGGAVDEARGESVPAAVAGAAD